MLDILSVVAHTTGMDNINRPTTAAARLADNETMWLVSCNPNSKAHLAYQVRNGQLIAVCNGRAMGRFALGIDGLPNVERCVRCAALVAPEAPYCVTGGCGQVATYVVSHFNNETDQLVQAVTACKNCAPKFIMGHNDRVYARFAGIGA